MDKILPRLYKEYGDYSNYRNFPLDLDGLKPVERRVLLSAYKIARDKLVKSRQIDSYATGHYHPHGECYGTIVQLVRQGFLHGQGNFGANIGIEPVGPAAPRYTECKMKKETIDLAFKYINFVPWTHTEFDGIDEPVFLPTKYPICLMGNEPTQGIGFGYRTLIPCYTMEDLKKRLFWLIGERKTKPTIEPITDCFINSSKRKLEQLLTTGKAKIKVEGVIEEIPISNKVILRSWPPGKRFESFLNKFAEEFDAGMIGFTDLSHIETEIVFQVIRERNRDKIFRDFVEKLQENLHGVISFESVVVDIDRKVKTKPIDEMLMDTFEMFSKANEEMLKAEENKIQEEIAIMDSLAIIIPYLTDCITEGYHIDKSVDVISKNTGISKNVVEGLLNKYKIKKLLTINTDTTELNKKLKETQKNLKHIKQFVLEQY